MLRFRSYSWPLAGSNKERQEMNLCFRWVGATTTVAGRESILISFKQDLSICFFNLQEFAVQWQVEQEQWLQSAFKNLVEEGIGYG